MKKFGMAMGMMMNMYMCRMDMCMPCAVKTELFSASKN